MKADFRKPQVNTSDAVNSIINKVNPELREHPTVKVGEKTYEIRKFKNRVVWKLIPQVADLVAVPVMFGLKESGLTLTSPNILEEALPDMISLFVTRLMELEDFAEFAEALLSSTYVVGMDTPVDFDEDFDQPEDIMVVVTEVLQVHFMGFIKKGLGMDLLAQVATARNLKDSLE